uniref:Uncharacterized protein n=1 Tax=Rhizophora mucronata TaxID=61149 RepID=A0A2P2R0B8_RHIMU
MSYDIKSTNRKGDKESSITTSKKIKQFVSTHSMSHKIAQVSHRRKRYIVP